MLTKSFRMLVTFRTIYLRKSRHQVRAEARFER